MKKIFGLFFKLIIGLISIVIIAAVVLIIALYDGENVTNQEVIDKNLPIGLVINNILYDGTDEVQTTKKADLKIEERDLEQLLYPVIMEVNQEGSPLNIYGIDVDVENGTYTLEVSFEIYDIFKSVLKANIKMDYSNNTFSLILNNAKVGSITISNLSSYIINYIDTNKLINDLHSKKIYVDIDFEQLKISITNDNFKKMISENIEGENKELISLLFDAFITNEDIMNISFGKDNLINALINFESMEYANEIIYNYAYNIIINNIKQLLSDNTIDYTSVNLMFNYYVKGYESLSNQEKNQLDLIDLKKYYSNDVIKNYKGILNKPSLTIEDYFSEIFLNKDLAELTDLFNSSIKLSDDFLTSLLQSFNFLGYSYAFSNENNEVGYLVIEQINLECDDQFIQIDLLVNINGFHLNFSASFDCVNNTEKGLNVSGKVKDVKLGDFQLTKEQNVELLSYLSSVLNSESWIKLNAKEEKILLDFSVVFSEIISKNNILQSFVGNRINSISQTYVEDDNVVIKFSLID